MNYTTCPKCRSAAGDPFCAPCFHKMRLRALADKRAYQVLRRILAGQTALVCCERFGFTPEEFLSRMESLLPSGCTMADFCGRDGLHVDHIRPRITFDYLTENDPSFRECWSLDNLQPLRAEDNRRKAARQSTERSQP